MPTKRFRQPSSLILPNMESWTLTKKLRYLESNVYKKKKKLPF